MMRASVGSAGPRVLVTEVQERSGLAAVRALALAGFAVGGAASSSPAQGHWSRYCTERFLMPDPRVSIEAYAAELEHVLRRGFDIVLPSTDASLVAISEQRERFRDLTRLGLPPKETVRLALDKVSLLRTAAESDLAPPASTVCADAADVRNAVRELGRPVLIKPHGTAVADEGGLRSQRGVVVRNDRDVDLAIGVIASPVVVQRYVAGGDIVSFAGVVADGRLLALAACRYLRTWPPDAGSASCAQTIEPSDDLVQRVEDLLLRTGWEGVFELELLIRGTEAHAIDLNPRLHGWLALAIRAGANLPQVWCEWLLGSRRPFVMARPGVHYRWEDGEFLNVVRYVSRGRLRDAARCIRPYRNTAYASTTLRDPLPLAARVVWVARRFPRWVRKQERAREMRRHHASRRPTHEGTGARELGSKNQASGAPRSPKGGRR
jgi:predicted ATP-grasp superfamily ATP-dependent carboligase